MRPFLGLLKKEFIQVFRDPTMLRVIFVMPVLQLMLFGYVVNTDVKEVDLDVYDFDQSAESRDFVNSMRAGNYFNVMEESNNVLEIEDRFRHFASSMALIIPTDFSEQIAQKDKTTIGLVVDGTDANSAGTAMGYAAQITSKFSQNEYGIKPFIEVRNQVLYNPEEESVFFMVPGIVATLLTMVSVMLTSMAIVRERELGTLEQLIVTPISIPTLILGKVIPFAILAIIEISIALTVGILWFHIPFAGSPILLFGLALLYLVTVLGIGLVFSTVTSTQQQAMFFSWFFSVFVMLTSGFFTPISNMPQWMQYVTYINPMRYFMSIVRAIMMKGAGIEILLSNIYPLIIYGAVIFSFAALMFAKRTK